MKKKRWLIPLLAADILLLAVIAGIVVQQMQAVQKPDEAALPKEEQLVHITQGMSYVTYAAEAEMANGQIAIWLSNGEENPYAIRAEILQPQTNARIAHSDWIEPGYRLEHMNAEQRLAPGDYPCLMRIELASPQGESIGKAGRSLLLSVK